MLGLVFQYQSNGVGASSGENLFVVLLVIDSTSHELRSPEMPGRLTIGEAILHIDIFDAVFVSCLLDSPRF